MPDPHNGCACGILKTSSIPCTVVLQQSAGLKVMGKSSI